MLLRLTIVLVLISAVLLLVGFVQNQLHYVYISMGCAALALVALVVLTRLSRRRAIRQAAAAGGLGVGRPGVASQPGVAGQPGLTGPPMAESSGDATASGGAQPPGPTPGTPEQPG